jgi:DNA-3-methyladenine glycosylase I
MCQYNAVRTRGSPSRSLYLMNMARPPDRRLTSYLASYDPHVAHLTMAVREMVLDEAPEAIESISKGYALAIGFSFTGKPLKDGFCHIATYRGHVNLGFNRGALLPDPNRLLAGDGKLIRHVTIGSENDLNRPFVRRFIQAAIEQVGGRPNRAADETKVRRCAWAESDPLYREYHDDEWGVPQYDSRALWEMLMLEGFQAGLSWITILRKRDAFRKAFKQFDPRKVARFGERDVSRLLEDSGIIRSRAKIEATVGGARAYLAMQTSGEDFSAFVWKMAGGKPIQNRGPVPASTPLSEALSKALKKRGFKFVGPVIVYAWMQACGIVNDHALDCFRRRELS